MRGPDQLLLIGRIALRNVLLHRAKSLIVGFILFFATCMMVVGSAIADAVSTGMDQSITQSLAGDLQVYSKDAKDELELFGGGFLGVPDLGIIPDFAAAARVIRGVPNVRAVVPMGSSFAQAFVGNALDRRLATLRQAVREGAPAAIRAARQAAVRHLVTTLRQDIETYDDISQQGAGVFDARERAALVRATGQAFWAGFDTDPLAALEFLENRVAPLQIATTFLDLQYLGTDVAAFGREFERFEVVKGQTIPPGARGLLFADRFYELQVKHPVARDLDLIRDHLAGGRSFQRNPEVVTIRQQLARQHRSILYQLDGAAAEDVARGLRALLGDDRPLPELVQAFLNLREVDFDRRYRFFYEHIAPHLELYSIPVGESITLKGFSRSGYVRSITVKVWGTFQFRGLEKSDVSGAYNMVDLATFRDLLGLITAERRQEIEALRQASGVEDLAREGAEDALFGGGAEAERPDAGVGIAAAGIAAAEIEIDRAAASDQATEPADAEEGVALHAAVLLADPSRSTESLAAVQAAVDAAGLNLKVVTGQQAAGFIGQFVIVVRVVLFVMVGLLLVVALVIVNNSMLMATMERIREIGTLRAIGAQRAFIAQLFLAETAALGLLAGALGALVGGGLVLLVGHIGIPATSDFVHFLFSGARLYPTLGAAHVLLALGVVFFFALISTLYPAMVAARTTPVEAMAEG